MIRLASLASAVALWVATASAQQIDIVETQTRPNEVQQRLVKELEVLRDEIARAHHEDKSVERDQLYVILKSAKSEPGGRYVADALWRNWLSSAPNSEIADKIEQAMERRRWYDYDGALDILDKVVESAPDYFEGWNQRAYVLFLQKKFDESLADAERVIALEPRHFAALSGKARILFHQGRHELAQKALKMAVEVHPWIYERFLLEEPPKVKEESDETKNLGDPF